LERNCIHPIQRGGGIEILLITIEMGNKHQLMGCSRLECRFKPIERGSLGLSL